MIYKAESLHFFYLDAKESAVMPLKNFYVAVLALATLIALPALADSLGSGGGSNISTSYFNGMWTGGTEVTTYSNGEITQRCENFHNKTASQGGGRNSGSQPVAQ
jgi:hypothetical protein